jgi:RNA polymerase sigma-70 factor (TIGR02957 family)
MRVLVAGATGVVGRNLVPKLVAAGHEVAGTTRIPAKKGLLGEMAATPFVVDVLDPDAVARAVAAFEPEVIVHEATALSSVDMRNFERAFALTNRLRTEGTDHLLAAGRAVGVRRFVAQSFAGWPFARSGPLVKTESDPLDPEPIGPMRTTLAAIRHLEATVTGADWTQGIVLRYGALYGPGTSLDRDGGEMTEMIRRRFFPIVGDGGGMSSFIHVADAADATVAAVERGNRGVYHVVDDEPAPLREWLPAVAAALGAPAPRRVPRWLGRLLAGEAIVTISTETRGASNELAKRVLGWQPRHASWRETWAETGAGGGGGGGGPPPPPPGRAPRPPRPRAPGRGTPPPHADLEAVRRRAFAIAYRMLGSVAEAEDIVQETLIRLHRAREAGRPIETAPAYVATVATRLAIDHLRSARVRREQYVGDWLPEPLVETAEGDPAQRAEMIDSLSVAFLAVLERLSPEQRAVLLLRDVFDYGYDEIAQILERTQEAVRQLAVRARRHVREERPRFAVSRRQHERLASTFFAAVERGDLGALESVLAEDVVLRGDGGGKAPALGHAVVGRGEVARTLLAWVRMGERYGGSLQRVTVNGGPGALALDPEGRLLGVWALDVAGGAIRGVASVVNPDKLRHIGAVGSLREVLAGFRSGSAVVD